MYGRRKALPLPRREGWGGSVTGGGGHTPLLEILNTETDLHHVLVVCCIVYLKFASGE
jgi:hypothetical protein